MLARGESCTPICVDPAVGNERRRRCFTDISKGMIFDGSTKYCTSTAIAIPRSDSDSQNRDGGMNETLDILSMHHYL